jgi:multidrug efflux pump subunit AcrB
MGPYMRPIPIGASAAMLFSLLVAFIVTPWAAVRILKPGKHHEGEREDFVTRLYRRFMGSLLHRPVLRWGFVGGVVVLLLASCSLFYFGLVKVKMLPFDNKSEFQVIVDMPNGTTLEETERVTQLLAEETQKQREVVNVQTYAGTASPYNFNGLVRHYYLRRGSNVSDIQVNLLPKGARDLQSHEIAKQVRIRIQPIADRYGARIKVAEVPPGPPVLETLVPKSMARVWTGGLHWPARFAACSNRRKVLSMSTGTLKTINRNTACRSTRKKLPSTASPKTILPARCR